MYKLGKELRESLINLIATSRLGLSYTEAGTLIQALQQLEEIKEEKEPVVEDKAE